MCVLYFRNFYLHRLSISQKAVFAKRVPALPHLTWEPECPCESRRMADIEEGEAGYAFPCLFIENVARFVLGLDRIVREVEIDKIVTA